VECHNSTNYILGGEVMLVVYGDLHLDDSKNYYKKASEKVIDFITTSDFNKIENDVLFLGDITSQNRLSGQCITYVDSLFANLKYKNIYILQGNHEGRVQYQEVSLTYDYLQETYKNITIIRNFGEYEISGLKTIAFPHIYSNTGRTNKWYESLLEQEEYKSLLEKEFDLCIGHITIADIDFYSLDKIKLPNIKAKNFLYGHIHSGDYAEQGYLGSFYPVTISEAATKRYFATIENKEKKLYPIKNILNYVEVKLGDPLPTEEENVYNVYTFKNCIDENEAKKFYQNEDLLIRACIYNENYNDNEIVEQLKEDISVKDNVKEYIDLFCKEKTDYAHLLNTLYEVFNISQDSTQQQTQTRRVR